MSCAGCSVKSKDSSGDKVSGCGSSGCATGGCNRLNTHDWLSDVPLSFQNNNNLYEVSFNNGSRKEFFRSKDGAVYEKNEMVTVEVKSGFDVGKISLRGELVKLQMKKKRSKEKAEELYVIYRLANEREIEQYEAAKAREFETMVRSRIIARDLRLDMKIGQVEYQADGKKATFYYIAEGRVDFRELIKRYATEFKIKIEMRQIGSRQEAGKIGGMGPCGRELCCSTWLTNFKSVSTSAVRYQNLSINQTKLSGQCGRLKCCLNYELDAYKDAIKSFPRRAPYLKTEVGNAKYIKNNIFKGLMFYQYEDQNKQLGLSIERVKEIEHLNKKGVKVANLQYNTEAEILLDTETTFEDGSGDLTLEAIEKTSKRIKNREKRKRNNDKKKKVQNPNQKNTNPNQKQNPNQKVKAKPHPNQKNSNPNQKNTNPNQKQNPNQKVKAKPHPNQKNSNPNQKNTNPNQKNSNPNQKNTNPNQNSAKKSSNYKGKKPFVKKPDNPNSDATKPTTNQNQTVKPNNPPKEQTQKPSNSEAKKEQTPKPSNEVKNNEQTPKTEKPVKKYYRKRG